MRLLPPRWRSSTPDAGEEEVSVALVDGGRRRHDPGARGRGDNGYPEVDMRSETRTGFTSLYPFLYAATGDRGGNASTRTKAEVRDVVDREDPRDHRAAPAGRSPQDADRLAACATAMADRFAAGGRLIAFGNGGSSTDAQDLARLFLWPGPDASALPALGADQRRRRGHRADQRCRIRRRLRTPNRRVRPVLRHCGGIIHKWQLAESAARVRPGPAARHADRRPGRLRRRQDGRSRQHRPPVRRCPRPPSTGCRRRRPPSTTCCGS